MALFVVDYGFCAGSHHYSSASSLRAVALEKGMSFELLAPRTSDLAANGGFPARYGLSHRLYDHPLREGRRLRNFWSRFSARRAATRNDLHRHLDERIASGDTVLLTTPMAPEFAGFADWHESLLPANRPGVAAHFLLPLGYDLAPDLPWQEEFALSALGQSFRRLRASAGGRALYLAHPRALAERLAALAPDIAVCASPFALPPAPPRPGAAAAELTVAFLGRGKAIKGIDLAFAAFDRLQAAGTKLRWIFQTAPLELSGERLQALTAPNVTHVRDYPSHARYCELFRSASIAVLPYHPAGYGTDQGSGVWCEALAMGIPVVCSEADYFVEQLGELGCPELVFRPYTAAALAAKIVEAATAYLRYRAIFAARAAAPGAYVTPESLLARLAEVPRGTPGDARPHDDLPSRANGWGASFISLLRLRLRARGRNARAQQGRPPLRGGRPRAEAPTGRR